MTMVVGFMLGLFASIIIYKISQSADQRAVSLDRGRAIPVVGRFPVILSTTGVCRIVDGPGYYRVGVEGCPLSIMAEPDRTIRVYGEIRDRAGVVVVQANGDSVCVLPIGGYDINSDHGAIEVIDNKGLPVFQLRIRSRAEWETSSREATERALRDAMGPGMQVEGRDVSAIPPPLPSTADLVETSSDKWRMILGDHASLTEQTREVFELNYVTVKEDGTWLVATPHTSKECTDMQEMKSLRVNIDCIFAYPGHKYPGKRAE
ncbi:MAG: hypothetical protein ABFE13_03515 [Phycisphaerales bacterium]